jgi:hypothetical protein
MPEPETYSLGETIRVSVKLKDEDGISRVYADFRKLRDASVGPGKLDPNGKIVLQGDGGGEIETTVDLTARVTDDSTPGNYLCVAIHVYDATGHLQTIETPSPSKVLRIVKEAEGIERPTEFLGWG